MEKPSATEINVKVYNETTLPVVKTYKTSKVKRKAQKRDKSDLGENFIAPDGGWAWLVCIAAGLSNLSIYPMLQQFGFIFRIKLDDLGMTSSQKTTIINTQSAISACTGLLNGPMFRRFSFRQVALAGSLIIFSGIFMTAFCETFSSFMLIYALILGFGIGISVSASSLAINTYFKNKRRQASGFSWTITGLGPILLPHIVTALLPIYGVQGTVLIFAAISLHSFFCGLIYQPVQYHAASASRKIVTTEENTVICGYDQDFEYYCKFCEMNRYKNTSIFSSQYLYMDDDEDCPGYEITDPGTPMLSRANDGWFGSRLSLTSGKKISRFQTLPQCKDLDGSKQLAPIVLEEESKAEEEFLKPNHFSRTRDGLTRGNSRRRSNSQGRSSSDSRCTCAEERALLQLKKQVPHLENEMRRENYSGDNEPYDRNVREISFYQKIILFLDLDLLRDITFVNLVAGLTLINFGELNFSILTPFILADFGFDTSQITMAMSVLGGMDLLLRFLVPFLTEKIEWDNRVFFLIAVVGIALGRTVVACSRSYPMILGSFIWIGACKGLRTIFWPLIIPGYVPLKRLPAASGLQLLITGIFGLICGPTVGLVRDRFDYSIMLHCLNSLTFISAISWTLEAYIRQLKHKQKKLACYQPK